MPPFIVKDLQIPQAVANNYSAGTAGNRITNLSRLNVFIGPNNCGKSRLLRNIFSTKELVFATAESDSEEVRKLACEAQNYIAHAAMEEDKREAALAWLAAAFPVLQTDTSGELVATDQLVSPQQLKNLQSPYQFISPDSDAGKTALNQIRRLNDMLERQRHASKSPTPFMKLYIPSLRGLRAPGHDRDFYLQRTLADYFQGMDQIANESKDLAATRILTGLELYRHVQDHLLGTLEQRELIQDYQEYLGTRFFDGQQVTLIPRTGTDVLYVKIGQEAEQPIFNLGDGIQQIIILTLPVFIHRKRNLLLFIEEPELFLHPGFQRLLIDTLIEQDGATRQVFIATHSHQFLDTTIDSEQCSVYKFSKTLTGDNEKQHIASFRIQNTTNEDFGLLRELGVRNSSVLLANCTIWVEGITDRFYLRKYLELFQADMDVKFVEDLHYSFVEYGGSNITHWSFLDHSDESIDERRVCGNMCLVADKDQGKDERHNKLSKSLGNCYKRLACREIENTLSETILETVIQDYEGGSAELNAFAYKDYRNEYLGRFIQDEVFKDIAKSKRRSKDGNPYAEKSGTIKGKVDFCRRAISNMTSKEQLSSGSINLAKWLYEFIASQQT